MKINNAFTLAEVLITLAIIGVVAAMTIPTLVSNYNDKVFETTSKKAVSILANGYKLMIANEGGNARIANLPFMTNCNKLEDESCLSANHKETFKIIADSSTNLDINSLPKEYTVTGNKNPSPFKWEDTKFAFTTGDGITYGILPNKDFTSIDIVVDVNGTKAPNTVKKDLRKFRLQAYGGAITDVSNELTESNPACSVKTPSGCKTEEECLALESEVIFIFNSGIECTTYSSYNNSQCIVYDCEGYTYAK